MVSQDMQVQSVGSGHGSFYLEMGWCTSDEHVLMTFVALVLLHSLLHHTDWPYRFVPYT